MSTRRHCDPSAEEQKHNCKLQVHTMLLLSPHNYIYQNTRSSLSLMILRLDLCPQYPTTLMRKFSIFHLFKVSSVIHQWADTEVQKIVGKDGCLLAHCCEILNLFLTFCMVQYLTTGIQGENLHNCSGESNLIHVHLHFSQTKKKRFRWDN